MKRTMKKAPKKPKARRYRLHMTFSEQDMRDIREEVSVLLDAGRLNVDRSKLDKLIYSAAWTFSQVLVKIDRKAAKKRAASGLSPTKGDSRGA